MQLLDAQQELDRRRQALQPEPSRIANIAARITRKTAVSTNGEQPKPETAAIQPFNPVRLDELDTNWHPLVETAVDAARAWQRRRRQQIADGKTANASLVLIASQVDPVRITGYGCGKTHIAQACLWSIAQFVDGIPAAPVGKFMMADDIIQALDGDTRIERLINYRSVWNGERGEMNSEPPPILVIDDIGTERVIPFVNASAQDDERQKRYFQIVNHAYENGISLIVTGNLTIKQLRERIGGRSWSRLQEMAPRGAIIDMTGVPDYRRRAGGR